MSQQKSDKYSIRATAGYKRTAEEGRKGSGVGPHSVQVQELLERRKVALLGQKRKEHFQLQAVRLLVRVHTRRVIVGRRSCDEL